MSNRDKYTLLSIPALIVAIVLAGGLVFLFWNENLIWILFTLIILSTLIYFLLIILGFYCSKFWAHAEKPRKKLVSWGLNTLILLVVVGLGIILSWDGIVAILLHTSGEITQAKIVECEIKTSRGNKYYRITYQVTTHNSDGVKQFLGKGELSKDSGCSTNQSINVHYLPIYPAISRMKISEGMVFVALAWNFYICLTGCIYFWIEKPKCFFTTIISAGYIPHTATQQAKFRAKITEHWE